LARLLRRWAFPLSLWTRTFSVWLFLALVTLASSYMVAFAQATVKLQPGSCPTGVVRDYEKPLRRMPADRVPARGQLPFVPAGLFLSDLGVGRTVLQGSRVGYEINTTTRAVNPPEHFRRPVPLYWDVHMWLSAVDRRGKPQRVVAKKRQRVGVLHRLREAEFFMRPKLGVYRFDMIIENWNGELLKAYRRYVRVLPSQYEVRIAVNRQALQSGELIIGRIENLGTLPVSIASRPNLKLERFSDGEWKSIEPGDADYFGPEGILLDGQYGFCRRLFVSSDTANETYRFTTVIKRRSRQIALTAPFSVD
jgi:hypothetical protein